MSRSNKLGAHIVLKRVDGFVVVEDRWHENGIFTVLSPHTWKKLNSIICHIADRIQDSVKRRKIIKKVTCSITLVVIVTGYNKTIAFLKSHQHPTGIRFDAHAWNKLVRISRKSISLLRLGKDKVSKSRCGASEDHRRHGTQSDYSEAQEDLSDLNLRLDNIHL
jgi:hypothetical protein